MLLIETPVSPSAPVTCLHRLQRDLVHFFTAIRQRHFRNHRVRRSHPIIDRNATEMFDWYPRLPLRFEAHIKLPSSACISAPSKHSQGRGRQSKKNERVMPVVVPTKVLCLPDVCHTRELQQGMFPLLCSLMLPAGDSDWMCSRCLSFIASFVPLQ